MSDIYCGNAEFNKASDYVVRMQVMSFVDNFKRLLLKTRGFSSYTDADKSTKLEIKRASEDLESKLTKLLKETLKLIESNQYRK